MGKLITDVNIMLYDDKHQELGRYSDWFGAMSSVNKAKYYRFEYNNNRVYQQHSLLPIVLLTQLINPIAIDWVCNNKEIYSPNC